MKLFVNTSHHQVKNRKEVGDDLSVCVLNILLKVSSLPILLAVNFTKVEI